MQEGGCTKDFPFRERGERREDREKRHEQKNGEEARSEDGEDQHVTEFKEDPMFEQSGDD